MTFLWLLIWALAGAPIVRGWWLATLVVAIWLGYVGATKGSK